MTFPRKPLIPLAAERLDDRVTPDAAYHSLAGGSFTQNWSGTAALLTTNDDWSQVPSVVGYFLDSASGVQTSGGTEPWTITTSTTAEVVDLIPNSTASSGTGGVHEIEASGAVALQGSGSARAPYLQFHLNATGRQNLVVSYTLAEYDGATADQKFALQFRVGAAAAWTDVPAGQVAGVFTTAGNQSVTLTNVALPAAVNNQSQVQVRVITTDAFGTDAMVGVDDITIASSSTSPPPAPTVLSIDRAAANPTNAATVAFTVTFDQPVSGVDAGDFALAGTASAGASISPAVTPAGPATTYTVTVNTAANPAGTLGLNLVDNDTITNTGGVALVAAGGGANGSVTGPLYDVDRVAPTVAFDDGDADNAVTTSTTLTYTMQFSEAVTGVTATAFTNAGSAAITRGTFTPAGDGRTFTLQVTPTGAGTLTLQVNAAGIIDGVGNALAAPLADDTTVAVSPPGNNPPTANPDGPYPGTEETTLSVPVAAGLLANDTDPDGPGPLRVVTTPVVAPASGTLVLNPDGSFVYVPAADVFGPVTFTYAVTDGAATATAVATIQLANVNDAPVARADAYTVAEDGTLTATAALGVRANDTDADGDALTVGTTPVSGPSRGTLALSADGSFTYTPAGDFFGTDSFTYSVTDGIVTRTATVTITVTPVNDPPTAVSDGPYTVAEDGTLTVFAAAGLLANDTDPDGRAELSVVTTPAAGPAHGTLLLNADGSFRYTPAANYAGTDSFTYTLTDGTVTTTATVSLVVTAVDDPPVLTPDSYTVAEDGTLTVTAALGLLANDTDADGPALAVSVTPAAGPARGTLALNADGSLTYTPAADFNGTDTILVTITQAGSPVGTTALTITVTPTADPPVARADSYTVAEDGTLTVSVPLGVRANDTDADGDALTVGTTPVSGPARGTLALSADGSFTYTPAGDFFGTDSFTYAVTDGTTTRTATVTITVTPVNDPPTAVADGPYSVSEDGVLTVFAAAGLLANDTDPDGTAELSVATTPAVGPSHGTLVLNADGSFRYTPAANYAGPDSFTYTLTDGTVTTTATVSLVVTAVDDPPVLRDDSYTVGEDGVLTVSAALGLLANDADIDGPALSVDVTPVAGPLRGTLALTANGALTYTPNGNFNGIDTVLVTLRQAGVAVGTTTLTITVTPSADPPVATGDSYTVAEDGTLVATTVLVNDTDPDGDTLTVGTTPVSGPAHGTLVLNTDGTFTYEPDDDFFGTDSFTYSVSDGTATRTATVTITVTPVADPPTAAVDSYTVAEDGTLTVFAAAGLLTNDTDPDGTAGLSVVTTPAVGPAHGTLALNADGSFTYTPAADYAGTDSFTYTLTDGTVTTTAVVTITVTPVNDPPVLTADAYTVDEDGTLTVALADGLLANDTDVDGDALTVDLTPVVGPTHGTLTLNADGTFAYDPADDFAGTDTFTYAATDGTVTRTAVVTITVVPVNDPPVPAADSYAVAEDGALTVPAALGLLGNDADIDGDALTVSTTPVSGPAHGTLTLAADGSFAYRPAADFAGTDSFEYAVSDGTATRTRAVTITVTPVDDPPVLVSDAYTVAEDGVLVVTTTTGLLANDADVDGPALAVSVAALAGPAHGTLALNADGSLTYTPDRDFAGTDSAVVQVLQSGAVVGTSVVTFTVTPTPDAPVAAADTHTVAEDGTLAVAAALGLLVNDTDADGDALVLDPTPVVAPRSGTLTLNLDGSFAYTPAANFAGTDTFTYRASDGTTTATAVVTIVVTPVSDPPVARPDAAAVRQGAGAVLVEVLSNDDAGPDAGARLTVTAVTPAAHGTVAVVGSGGAVTYLPAPGFVGTDTFTYTVANGSGVTATATVSITVEAAPVPPASPPPPTTPPTSPLPPTLPPASVSPPPVSPPPPANSPRPTVIVTGAGPGGGRVTVRDGRTGAVRADFFPYGVAFTGGVRVAAGDVTGDGVPDVFTAAGVGGGPHVRGFDGATGEQLAGPLGSFFAFDSDLRNGVWLAVGDVTGDGTADVIVGAGPGGGPHVKAFDGATGELVRSFFPFDPELRTGVTVAAGDLDGDGAAEIVTAAGAGGGPHVKAFDGRTMAEVASFFAYLPSFTGGVNIATGDLDGDGRAEIITGTGPGGGPHVKVFDAATGAERSSFFAFDAARPTGVSVAAADVTGDGRAEVVTGSGAGGLPRVRAYTAAGGNQGRDLEAFDPAFLGGVYVGAA